MSTNLTCFAFVNTEIFSFKVRTFFFWEKSNLAICWTCKELNANYVKFILNFKPFSRSIFSLAKLGFYLKITVTEIFGPEGPNCKRNSYNFVYIVSLNDISRTWETKKPKFAYTVLLFFFVFFLVADNVTQHFCTKTLDQGEIDWPSGRYCIYKKGECPKGFKNSSIFWDDEDTKNTNKGMRWEYLRCQ